MNFARLRCAFYSLFAAAALAGCATAPRLNPFYSGPVPPASQFPKPETKPPQASDESRTFWKDDPSLGQGRIVVRLNEQRAYFYRGKRLVGATHISSGKKSFATPPGSYRVIQKDKDHASTLYGDFVGSDGEVVKANVDTSKDRAPAGATFRGAKMPYFLRFQGGYGLHAGRVPNHPASHGCVRLPSAMAKHFFQAAEIGTPVRVED